MIDRALRARLRLGLALALIGNYSLCRIGMARLEWYSVELRHRELSFSFGGLTRRWVGDIRFREWGYHVARAPG